MKPPIERDPWSGLIAFVCALLLFALICIAAVGK